MMDMTTSELQEECEKWRKMSEATKATNKQLIDNMEAVRKELEDTKASNRDLTGKLNAETEKVKELESSLKEARHNYETAYDQLDAQISDNIRMKIQRDTWKKVAKWLCRNAIGGNSDA